MKENRAKGMIGIWSLTSGQVIEANEAPLPPESERWLLEVGNSEVELDDVEGQQVYDGTDLTLEHLDEDTYRLRVATETHELDHEQLRETLVELVSYVPRWTTSSTP